LETNFSAAARFAGFETERSMSAIFNDATHFFHNLYLFGRPFILIPAIFPLAAFALAAIPLRLVCDLLATAAGAGAGSCVPLLPRYTYREY
jgi:hypothetical protein